MTRLSTAQVYAYARQGGFSPAAAVLMTAITAAESSNITDRIGDQNLTEPGEKSVGLTQINYRPSRDRGNSVRDPQANLDPLTNMQHAFIISGGGKRFTPWSTFTNGAYAKYLTGARTVAAQPTVALPVTGTSSTAGSSSSSSGQGVDWQHLQDLLNPATAGSDALKWLWDNTGGGVVKDAERGIIGAVYKVGLTLTVIGGGIFLVVMGLRETVAPALDKARGQAAQGAQIAALAA